MASSSLPHWESAPIFWLLPHMMARIAVVPVPRAAPIPVAVPPDASSSLSLGECPHAIAISTDFCWPAPSPLLRPITHHPAHQPLPLRPTPPLSSCQQNQAHIRATWCVFLHPCLPFACSCPPTLINAAHPLLYFFRTHTQTNLSVI